MKILVISLLVAFVVLKFTNYITWTWGWVLSPLWIGIILWLLFTAIGIWFGIREMKAEEKAEEIREQNYRKGLRGRWKDVLDAQERLQNEKKQQR